MINKICKYIDNLGDKRVVFSLFLFAWLLLNLLQAFFTELAHDEAYYWMYSQNLDWGYFDHPSMIAILVKIGYAIFPNELGVRLLPCLLGTSTIYIIYRIVRDEIKSVSLLMLMLASVVLLKAHVGGFLAIPDIPLVFFAALFYLLYKHYLLKDSWLLSFAIGVVSAAMMYSKYHAVLVLFFTLISNFSILKRKSFWLIPIVVVLAMIPHLMWQINANFPTFSYHLVGRSSAYSIDRTLNYIAGQLLITGPFAGFILLYHAARTKISGDVFTRSMKFNFLGFFVFFFLSSFKGHVEAHWTAIGFIPLLVLSFRTIQDKERPKKWLRYLYLPSLLIFLFVRVGLLVNFFPHHIIVGQEFHGYDTWAKDIKEVAGERRLVFINSFQYPSKYVFYSGGEFAYPLNSIHYRQNQYDLWNYESMLQNQDVLIVGGSGTTDTLTTDAGDFAYRKVDGFKSYYDIKIITDIESFTISPGDSVLVQAKIINTRDRELIFESADSLYKPKFEVNYHSGKTFLKPEKLQEIDFTIQAGDTLSVPLYIPAPIEAGEYAVYLSIVNDKLYAPFNSRRLHMMVE